MFDLTLCYIARLKFSEFYDRPFYSTTLTLNFEDEGNGERLVMNDPEHRQDINAPQARLYFGEDNSPSKKLMTMLTSSATQSILALAYYLYLFTRKPSSSCPRRHPSLPKHPLKHSKGASCPFSWT